MLVFSGCRRVDKDTVLVDWSHILGIIDNVSADCVSADNPFLRGKELKLLEIAAWLCLDCVELVPKIEKSFKNCNCSGCSKHFINVT